MNIAIIGASGFLGRNLIKHLLINTDYKITAISPNPNDIFVEEKYKERVYKIQASVFDYTEMEKALTEIDIAYYFVHMMANNKNDFYKKEALAAETTGRALQSQEVKRVIYMSGLGNDKEKLSEHLASRHNTGEILRKYNIEVIELRASMIIGEGSISFEIIRNIVDKSPIIILPKWTKTLTQPIGIDDALLYLRSSINLKINKSETIEIGGPDSMSYEEFIKKYVKYKKKKTIIVRIPILSEKLAGLFLTFFTSKEQAHVGQCMLSSFKNEMIVTNKKSILFFPDIYPHKIEDYFV